MALKIKKDTSFKKWFDIPGGDGAKIELWERSEGEILMAIEALYTKATAGADITDDLERAYVDAISDWQGVEDEDGKALKLTAANKRLFIRQPGMYLFFKISLAELRAEAEKEREEAQKN